MSTVAEVRSTPVTIVSHVPWWRGKLVQVAVVVGVMWLAYRGWKAQYPWPASLTWNSLPTHLNDFQTWLVDERNVEHPSAAIRAFNGFSSMLDWLVTRFTDLLGWMTWVGAAVAGIVVSLRFGGARAGLWALAAFATFAACGLWAESMQTLALMLVAVGLSLLVGLPLGVLAGLSDRFLRTITPVLDAMQIIPAFAYLMPVVILFSVGPGAAVITTMIYAIPPAIRITALGIRGVPTNTVEAAEAMGSTRGQLLRKVRLPLARRTLLLGVNQTILFALSMVVIAGLVGGRGLGDVVTSGLNSYPALALLAGLVIVVMAMALDRITGAIAEQTNPVRRHLTDALRRRLRLASLALTLAVVGTVAVARVAGASSEYPRQTARDWVLARLQSALDYVQNPDTRLFGMTSWIGNHIVEYGLVPFQNFLVETPWPVTLGGVVLIAFVVSGLRSALVALCMFSLIGFVGEWASAMDTAAQVLVATVLTVIIGFGLGVWAAENAVVSKILRPVNDLLQALPQLVYLIPLIYLMPVSVVPGVVAGVLYAFPVVARLVESGVRGVDANTVEAAQSFGATRGQVLRKVKIPLAGDAVMLGVNQGIIMVLAVVVIGGLVGSGGLGYEVAQGLARSDFGLGVSASVAILALGIALDRVTRGVGTARRKRLP